MAGLTLPELMIAMVVGLIIVGGVIALFLQGRQSFRIDDHVARMQDEARFAVAELSRDLRMAAFLGEPLVPANILLDPALAIGTDCGPDAQVFDVNDALTGIDNAVGATVSAAYSCIEAADFVDGTDVVGIKRVAGETIAEADRVVGESYIRSNGVIGLLYRHETTNNIPSPFADRPWRPHIYYIRSFSDTPGDGLPSLCRKTLQPGATPTMVTECIARGIEDLQLEYGFDADGDGTPERFVPEPGPGEWERVVAVRFLLLARTDNPDIHYSDDRTYRLSNAAEYVPADNFHRRVYSTTVGVYNRKNIMRLGI